jgi:hypothetical protein
MVTGTLTGALAKDTPAVETVVADAEKIYATVAESSANPRSALFTAKP